METKDSLQKFGHKMRVMPTSKKQPNIIKAASNDHFHQDIQNGCKEPGSYSDPKKPFNSTISDWKADLYGFIEFPFKGHIHGMGEKKGGGTPFPPCRLLWKMSILNYHTQKHYFKWSHFRQVNEESSSILNHETMFDERDQRETLAVQSYAHYYLMRSS